MGGIGELGISLPTLITQIVTFIILLVLLRFVAYKPIMRMMDERSKRVKESMEQAEELKKQSAAGQEEMKKQLEEMKAALPPKAKRSSPSTGGPRCERPR